MIGMEGGDKLWWIPSKKGLFIVSSFYNVFVCNGYILFFLGEYLVDQGSSESSLFCFVSGLEKIFTMDNLKKRHPIVVDRC